MPRLATLVALALAASLLAGCAPVQERPSLETAVARYDEMLSRMRDTIGEVLGATEWTQLKPASTTPGDHAYGEGSKLAHSAVWSLPGIDYGNLDAATHTELVNDISDIAQEYGFSRLTLYVDRDDEMQAVTGDSFKTELEFGAQQSVTLSYNTQSLPPGGATG